MFGASAATVSPKPSELSEEPIDLNFYNDCESVIFKTLKGRIVHKARATITDDTLEQVVAVYGKPTTKGTVPGTFIDFIAYDDELYAFDGALPSLRHETVPN